MSNNEIDELKKKFSEQVENVPEESDSPAEGGAPDEQAEAEQQDDIDPGSIPDPEPEPEPEHSDDQKRKSCKQLVKLGGQGQEALFAYLYRKAYFTDNQWEHITRAELPKTEANQLENQEDIQLKQRYEEYQAQIKTIPLTGEEEQDLADHLKEAMDYLEKQPPSPVTALIIAVLSTLGSRAMPLLFHD